MVRIWDQHLASLPKKKRGEVRKLPVIVPIVLHHGRDGWTAAASFEAADVPELDVWTERVMTASQLEDVIGPTPA